MIPLFKRAAMEALTGGPALWAARTRAPKPHAVVLMYHEVAEDEVDIEAWTVVRRTDLLRQLDYLSAHYDVVSLDTALQRFEHGADSPRPAAIVTFDDGNKGNVEILLPLIERAGLPVTIYIATGHIEAQQPYWFDRIVNALQTAGPVHLDLRRFGLRAYDLNRSRGEHNWSQIQRLLEDMKELSPERCETVSDETVKELAAQPARGSWRLRPMTRTDIAALARSRFVEIGGHTHCHTLQTMLSESERRESIERNRALLQAWTGREIRHFAYPSGAHNPSVTDDVRAAGYSTAVTTTPGVWRRNDDVFQIPRSGVGRYDAMPTFKACLFGGPRALFNLLMTGRLAGGLS